jgi:Ser/Thr protein kinase RdoA (MazF antagonist)
MSHVPTVSAGIAEAIARRWVEAPSNLLHLRQGENAVYAFDGGARRLILRLTSVLHRSRDQLQAELDFIEHLAAGGLRVARGVPTAQGELVVDVSEAACDGAEVFACVFERAAGRQFAYFSEDVDEPLFLAWGEAMGRLHARSLEFRPRAGRQRPEWWNDSVAGCDLSGVAPRDDFVFALRDELVGWLRALPIDRDQYGWVHGDFERSNFLIGADGITVFDFDDCCRHWFVWDVACALWVFRGAPPAERRRFLDWFLSGYVKAREPDAPRLRDFSAFIRLRTVSLLLHRLRRPESLQDAEARAWIERTREWLRVPSPW